MKDPAHLNSVKPVYHPFGMLLSGRSWEVGSGYRYGFNGKEHDVEVNGSGNVYDYGFRIYNPRLGKFLSVDPLTKSFAWYSPYHFSGNKPIAAKDLDGSEEYIVIRWYDATGSLTFSGIMKVPNAFQINGMNGSVYFELSSSNPADANMFQQLFGTTPNLVASTGAGLFEANTQWNQIIFNDNGTDGNGLDDSRILTGSYQDFSANGDINGLRPYERDIVDWSASNNRSIKSSDDTNPISSALSRIVISRQPIVTYFDNDVAPLNPTNTDDLSPMINAMLYFPSLTATIEGNTDNNNTDSYNLELGERRAEAVSDYLQSQGIASTRLTTISNGERTPRASNDTEEGRALNRNTVTTINYPTIGN